MKEFTEQQIDDIIKLKFGTLASTAPSTAYVSDRVLGRIFKASGSKIRQLYTQRFEANKVKLLPLMEILQRS